MKCDRVQNVKDGADSAIDLHASLWASSRHQVLRRRVREAGLLLISCNEQGKVLPSVKDGSSGAEASDWFEGFFRSSGFVHHAIKQAVETWAAQDQPAPIAAAPGLWLAPIPLVVRRRRCGYAVVIAPTERLLESEHFSAICRSVNGGADERVCRSLLAQASLCMERDVARLIALVTYLHEDQVHLSADEQAMESTGQQLAESYEEINLLYTIIQNMTAPGMQQPARFIRTACQELLGTLPYGWIGVRLAEDPERLKALSGKFIAEGHAPGVRDTPVHDASDDGSRLPARLMVLTEALLKQLLPDTAVVLDPQSNPAHSMYASLGSAVLIQPISSDGRVIGMYIAGDKHGTDSAVSSVDMKLLSATASHTAIFLENAALYDDLNAMFLGTLEALTASIDAKDRYTCGHSRRVAHLTQQLARAVGMSPEQVKRMHIAGLVHDVGKIGVPEHVLLKPGKLTDEEFAWIRRHPEMGHRILKDIPQLKDILPGVLYHHERWDGRGYPAGLAGEEIPFVARLIGLADSFDAMSSTRTYRCAMDRKSVLDEIRRCGGAQFDPELAPIFVNLDFTEYDRMVREHQAAAGPLMQLTPGSESPGKEAA